MCPSTFKGVWQEIFDFGFFYESVSPGPLGIPFCPLRIRGDIRNFVGIASDKLSTGVNNTDNKLLPVSLFHYFRQFYDTGND